MATDPALKAAKLALCEHLESLPEFGGVGVGQDSDGSATLRVLLKKPVNLNQSGIPQSFQGFPVTTKVVGSIRAR